MKRFRYLLALAAILSSFPAGLAHAQADSAGTAAASPALKAEMKRVEALYASDRAASEAEVIALIDRIERETGFANRDALNWGDNLRFLYSSQGRVDDKIALLTRFLHSLEASVGPDHPSTLDWVIRLGFDLMYAERHGEAEPYFLRNLEARRAMNSQPDDDTQYELTQAARNTAQFYEDAGDYEKAETYWLETIAAATAHVGEADEETVEWMDFLGRMYGDSGQSEKRIALYNRIIALRERHFGADDWWVEIARERLADTE
ncbi:MAG: tetratricopeptide repeat protein [Blastomonas sp.]